MTTYCKHCGHYIEFGQFPFCPHGDIHGNLSPLGMHKSEVTVVYENPATGKVCYPGRADVPMPERYARQGFEKRELRTLREVDRFSKFHGVTNERAHFDRNGKGLDV
jgi:hypothetical protein